MQKETDKMALSPQQMKLSESELWKVSQLEKEIDTMLSRLPEPRVGEKLTVNIEQVISQRIFAEIRFRYLDAGWTQVSLDSSCKILTFLLNL